VAYLPGEHPGPDRGVELTYDYSPPAGVHALGLKAATYYAVLLMQEEGLAPDVDIQARVR
jgi:hypothetical protein